MSRKFIGIAAGVIVVSAAVTLLCVQAGFVKGHRIARGVRVGGVDLGGCVAGAEPSADVETVKSRLAAWSHARGAEPISFSVDGRTWTGKLADLGVVPDMKAIEAEALAVGRKGNIIRRIFGQYGLSPHGTRLKARYKIDRDKLSDVLDKIDEQVCKPAIDARITFSDGVRNITPEVYGTTVDSDATYQLLQQAVEKDLTTVELAVVDREPEVKAADLQKVDTKLASFTTIYPGWKHERTHNIKLAVAGINGRLVHPGATFSYNKAVGPRLRRLGFQDALIYQDGKIIPGTGGGICQVSSTLYNAALFAGLRIKERHNHSMRVPYVSLGRDATVAYGSRDLKFLNTTSSPIYISANASHSRLNIVIYGNGAFKQDVRVFTTKPKRIVRRDGKTVTMVTVYRVLSRNGQVVSRERVSSDRYNPAPPHDATPPAPARVARTGSQG